MTGRAIGTLSDAQIADAEVLTREIDGRYGTDPVHRLIARVVVGSQWIEDHDRKLLEWAADRCCTCHNANAPHEDWCVATGILAELLDEDGDRS